MPDDIAAPPRLKGAALIKDEVKRLPDKPGVYRMMGEDGEVLYVGKARSLKKRVSQYAQGRFHAPRIGNMVHATRSMEFIVTRTEADALLLEINLIKQLKPRFNVLLRDDKSFPEIVIRREHPAAQLRKHRGAHTIKGDYFGPFASAYSVNKTLNTLQKAFLLRSCSDSVYESRTRPCMLHQIKRCAAPCTGLIALDDYAGLVEQAEDFLRGRSRQVMARMAGEMQALSDDMEFERAARLRDRIRALASVAQETVINPTTFAEADVFAIHAEGGQACVQVFFFRAGQNWGNRAYFPRLALDDEDADVMGAFLGQFYDDKPIPKLILTNVEPADAALLAEAFAQKSGHKVEISTPQRGEKRQLVEHATVNAREALGRKMSESSAQAKLLNGVADAFGLDAPPERIEVYDNSHIMGTNAVGGMIVAGPDGFQKSQYRKFNIKGTDLTPGDDFGMMKEVLRRRFARLAKEEEEGVPDGKESKFARPDLLLIDGGAGAGGDGRPGRRRHRRGRRRQGRRPRRRDGAVLHPGQGALPARSQEPGPLLPPAPARRGAPLRHRNPPRQARGGDDQEPAGRDRRRGPRPQARAAGRLRVGTGREPRGRGGPGQGRGRERGAGRADLRLLPQGLAPPAR